MPTDDELQAGRMSVANIGGGEVDYTDWKRLANSSPILYLGLTTGTGDTYVATPSPALAAYYTGLIVVLATDEANTGAATLNISGLGATALKVKGSDPADNAFDANAYYSFVYTAAGTFEQINPA